MGASLGAHKVTITTQVWSEPTRKPAAGQTARDVTEAATGESRSELLPERYRSRKATILTADIESGKNIFDFDLESK